MSIQPFTTVDQKFDVKWKNICYALFSDTAFLICKGESHQSKQGKDGYSVM